MNWLTVTLKSVPTNVTFLGTFLLDCELLIKNGKSKYVVCLQLQKYMFHIIVLFVNNLHKL